MIRVALTTEDGSAVDQHFGWCNRFDIYDISAKKSTFVASRVLAPESESATESENKIDARLSLIRDCVILCVSDIGAPAAARVTNARIHPLKVAEGTSVGSLLSRIQGVLSGNPPPWLRRALHRSSSTTTSAWST